MSCPVCGMVHIKDPFLLIKKSSHITEKLNVLNVLLNKTYSSFPCWLDKSRLDNFRTSPTSKQQLYGLPIHDKVNSCCLDKSRLDVEQK